MSTPPTSPRHGQKRATVLCRWLGRWQLAACLCASLLLWLNVWFTQFHLAGERAMWVGTAPLDSQPAATVPESDADVNSRLPGHRRVWASPDRTEPQQSSPRARASSAMLPLYIQATFVEGAPASAGLRVLTSSDGVAWLERPDRQIVLKKRTVQRLRVGSVLRDPALIWWRGYFHLAFTTEICAGQASAAAAVSFTCGGRASRRVAAACERAARRAACAARGSERAARGSERGARPPSSQTGGCPAMLPPASATLGLATCSRGKT